jgi:hypothetical protein
VATAPTLDPNAIGKRTATTTGSSGPSPPHKWFRATCTYQGPQYVIHFEGFLFLLFSVGLLTPASALQGVER